MAANSMCGITCMPNIAQCRVYRIYTIICILQRTALAKRMCVHAKCVMCMAAAWQTAQHRHHTTHIKEMSRFWYGKLSTTLGTNIRLAHEKLPFTALTLLRTQERNIIKTTKTFCEMCNNIQAVIQYCTKCVSKLTWWPKTVIRLDGNPFATCLTTTIY